MGNEKKLRQISKLLGEAGVLDESDIMKTIPMTRSLLRIARRIGRKAKLTRKKKRRKVRIQTLRSVVRRRYKGVR